MGTSNIGIAAATRGYPSERSQFVYIPRFGYGCYADACRSWGPSTRTCFVIAAAAIRSRMQSTGKTTHQCVSAEWRDRCDCLSEEAEAEAEAEAVHVSSQILQLTAIPLLVLLPSALYLPTESCCR